jgi:hypothetical protein
MYVTPLFLSEAVSDSKLPATQIDPPPAPKCLIYPADLSCRFILDIASYLCHILPAMGAVSYPSCLLDAQDVMMLET